MLIERAIERSNQKGIAFKSRGQLSPRERLNAILDPDTFFWSFIIWLIILLRTLIMIPAYLEQT